MGDDPDDRSDPRAEESSTTDGLAVERYDLVVEAYLAHPSILLCPTLDAVSESTVRPQSQTTYRGRQTLFFTAANADFDVFESALVDDTTVCDPTLVGVDSNYRTYRVGLSDAARWPTEIPESLGASVTSAENNSGGWHVRMRLPGRAVLSALSTRCRETDVDFRVRQLYSPDAADGRPGNARYGVTDDQEQLLRTAYEMGYYDVPRRSSQNELAEQFGVSPSAVSQQLRRGTGALVGNTLATPSSTPPRDR
ncbi:hypothetical protein AUR64_19445 [Haloprofundus marisrubri]|uniref:DNA-binding protein n=2 Tax=Haloprofundus marisrubri TaxID=1514971 RepID=A0A0W1R4T7_9EURY|nr:hypothetical protein AUR64_19445 [Haloprofundus marisrubri]